MASLIYILPLVIWMLLVDTSGLGVGTFADEPAGLYPAWMMFVWWAAVLAVMWLRTRLLISGRGNRGSGGHGILSAWGRFARFFTAAQVLVLIGFGFGILLTSWPTTSVNWVRIALQAVGSHGTWTALDVLAGVVPVYGALWACHMVLHPLNTLVREQNIMRQLELGLPVRALPTFWQSAWLHLRVPMLMSVVPVMLAMVLNDTLDWLVPVKIDPQTVNRPEGQVGHSGSRETDSLLAWIVLWKWAMVMIGTLFLAPVVLGWVMGLSKLKDEKLLALLKGVLSSAGGGGGGRGGGRGMWLPLRLWPTHHLLANAAVLGVIPGTRKIVLSDLLLETFTDDQLRAVVAHEVGHVKRRHLNWLMFGIVALALGVGALSEVPGMLLKHEVTGYSRWLELALYVPALGLLAGGIFGIGWLMRHFELEADAYAAMAVSKSQTGPQGEEPNTQAGSLPASGALVVASALHRISDVTNVPMGRHSFTHGSLESRAKHLAMLASTIDPHSKLTGQNGPVERFLKKGRRVRLSLFLAAATGVCLFWILTAA